MHILYVLVSLHIVFSYFCIDCLPMFSFSPGTSPDSPEGVFSGQLSPITDESSRFPRSKSISGMAPSMLQNGSRIPRLDASKTSVKPESNFPRCDSENNLQKRMLQKQVGTIDGVGDDDSLSGTESVESDGKTKKEKKKLKLIPKFMRKTDHIN